MPQPGKGQVRVRVSACGICATELEMIAGWDRTGFPSIPGHEWAGTVDAAGLGVDGGMVGCRCVADNVLSDGGEVGFEHPGGYGQFLLTEARNVQALPENFPFGVAPLVEPLAVSVRGIRRLRLEDKSSALILGDGPIGLLMLMQLRCKCVNNIVMVGGRASRLALASDLGAQHTVNHHEAGDDLVKAVRKCVARPFSNVIEATGSAAAAQAGFRLLADQGKMLMMGDYRAARSDFPWLDVVVHEIELIGTNASAQAWPDAVQMASELPLHRLVTHELPAARFAEAVELVRGRRPDVIKVLLKWQ